VDSIAVVFYRGKDLIYAACVRGGLLPTRRREVFEKLKHLKTAKCPFVILPELAEGRWGQRLTAEKMKECVCLKPEEVARIEFLEWTGVGHLRSGCDGFRCGRCGPGILQDQCGDWTETVSLNDLFDRMSSGIGSLGANGSLAGLVQGDGECVSLRLFGTSKGALRNRCAQ